MNGIGVLCAVGTFIAGCYAVKRLFESWAAREQPEDRHDGFLWS